MFAILIDRCLRSATVPHNYQFGGDVRMRGLQKLEGCKLIGMGFFSRQLIVTSAYHSRRALWSMRRASEGSGIELGIDGPPPGWQTPSPMFWWLRKRGWHVVAGEYPKLAYYRLAH